MVVRNPKSRYGVLQVGMIADHHRDVRRQLTTRPSPEELQESVLVLRHHDRHLLQFGGVGKPPVHAVALGYGVLKCALQQRTRDVQVWCLKLKSQEERAAFRICGVLIECGHVGPVVVQEV